MVQHIQRGIFPRISPLKARVLTRNPTILFWKTSWTGSIASNVRLRLSKPNIQASSVKPHSSESKARKDRARISQPPDPPPPPTIDHNAEPRRLQRRQEYQAAVAEQAHKDAKRVEAEVKRQARRDNIGDKRRHWWNKNKDGNVSLTRHPFPSHVSHARDVLHHNACLSASRGTIAHNQ